MKCKFEAKRLEILWTKYAKHVFRDALPCPSGKELKWLRRKKWRSSSRGRRKQRKTTPSPKECRKTNQCGRLHRFSFQNGLGVVLAGVADVLPALPIFLDSFENDLAVVLAGL